MNLDIFQSPLVMTVTIIMICFLSIFFAIVLRRTQQMSVIKSEVREAAVRRRPTSFTVMVELERSARTIQALFDHLESQAYPLEVIIIVKRKAGKRAYNQIDEYNEKYESLAIHPIRYSRKLTRAVIAKQQATSELLLWLHADQRLPQRFFERASLRFINPSTDALEVRRHVILDSSLTSAYVAWRAILMDIRTVFRLAKPERPLVFRRSSFDAAVKTIRYDSALSYQRPVMKSLDTPHFRHKLTRILKILVLVGLIVVYLSNFSEGPFIALVLAASYVMLGFFIQASYEGYRLIERISLTLFTPFLPITYIARNIASRQKHI